MLVVLTVYLSCVALYSKVRKESETPPLSKIMDSVAVEFYTEYLLTGKYPTNTVFLSDRAKNLLVIYKDQIQWDPVSRHLKYTYERPYSDGCLHPLSTLSFKIIGSPVVTGEFITESMVTNNAALFKKTGRL